MRRGERRWTDVGEKDSVGERNPLDVLVLSMQAQTLMPKMELENISKTQKMARFAPKVPALGLEWQTIVGTAHYSSTPVAKVMTLQWVHWTVIVIGCAFFTINVVEVFDLLAVAPATFAHYRFTALETRGGGGASHPGVSAFGMLESGHVHAGAQNVLTCRSHAMEGATWETQGASMLLHVGTMKHERHRGVYIVTGNASQRVEEDPVRFEVHGSDDLQDWTLVAASKSFIFSGATMTLLPEGYAEIPLDRDTGVRFELQAGFWHQFAFNLNWLNFWTSCVAAGVMGKTGRISMVTPTLVGAFALISSTHIVSGLILLSTSPLDSLYLIGSSIGFAIPALGFWKREAFFDFWLLAATLLDAGFLVTYGILCGQTPSSVMFSGGVIANIVFALSCVGIISSRIRLYFWCNRLALHDRQVYEPEWAAIQRRQAKQLTELSDLISRLKPSMPSSLPLQLPWQRKVFRSRRGRGSSRVSPAETLKLQPQAGHTRTRRWSEGSIPSMQNLCAPIRRNSAAVLGSSGASTLPLSGPAAASHSFKRRKSFLRLGDASVAPVDVARTTSLPASAGWAGAEADAGRTALGAIAPPAEGSQSCRNTVARADSVLVQKPQELSQVGKGSITLDTLQAQALLLEPLLLSLTVELSKMHKGLLPLRKNSAVTEVGESESVLQLGQWDDEVGEEGYVLGGVKGVARCFGKTDMVYRGDRSKLLDVCRQRIFFDQVEDLVACLSSLSQDPHVSIVRIKNSLNPKKRSGMCCMRLVKVNLKLCTSYTARACLDNHVCELLLIPSAFARVCTREMYLRFIALRNAENSLIQFNAVLPRLFQEKSKKPCVARRRSSVAWAGVSTQFANEIEQQGDVDIESCADASGADAPRRIPEPSGPSQVAPTHSSGDAAPAHPWSFKRRFSSVSQESRGYIFGSALSFLSWPSFLSDGRQMPADDVSNRRRMRSICESQEVTTGGTTSWGDKICDRTMEVLVTYARESAKGRAESDSESWAQKVHIGFDSSNIGSVLFTSMPLSAASTKWPYQLIFCAVVAVHAWFIGEATQISENFVQRPYTTFRFTNFETRNGTTLPAVPGVFDFGVVGPRQCSPLTAISGTGTAAPVPEKAQVLGSSYLVSYSQPVEMQGWHFRLADGDESGKDGGLDPFYFEVFGTNDEITLKEECLGEEKRGDGEWCSGDWDQIGAPVWRLIAPAGYLVDFAPVGKQLTEERSAIVTFSLSPGWPWILFRIVAPYAQCLLCLSFVILGRFGGSKYVGVIMAFSSVLHAVTFAVAGVGLFHRDLPENAWECLTRIPASLLIAILLMKQTHFRKYVWATAITCMGMDLLLNVFVYKSPLYFYENFVLQGPFLFILISVVTIYRVKITHDTLALVRLDAVTYDAVWQKELKLDVETGGITHLNNVVRMLGVEGVSPHCRQYSRARVDELQKHARETRRIDFQPDPKSFNPIFQGVSPLYVPVPRTVRHQAPITTGLDLLYAQAALVRIALMRKCKVWAAETNGMFHVPQTPTEKEEGKKPVFVKWTDVKHLPHMDQQISDDFPPLKSRSRAIEKLLRVYHDDTSRLLDLARCQIVFETVGDLTKCLGIMATDFDVRIERVKNRMHRDISADDTAGYRDLCINLKLDEKALVSMGAENHICEVQLILSKFAELKTSWGHNHYRRLRNTRGL